VRHPADRAVLEGEQLLSAKLSISGEGKRSQKVSVSIGSRDGSTGREGASALSPLEPSGTTFDDNADDSCTLGYAYHATYWLLNSLFTVAACSWQCGGQGFESP